jgi:hypothetical protein
MLVEPKATSQGKPAYLYATAQATPHQYSSMAGLTESNVGVVRIASAGAPFPMLQNPAAYIGTAIRSSLM